MASSCRTDPDLFFSGYIALTSPLLKQRLHPAFSSRLACQELSKLTVSSVHICSCVFHTSKRRDLLSFSRLLRLLYSCHTSVFRHILPPRKLESRASRNIYICMTRRINTVRSELPLRSGVWFQCTQLLEDYLTL